jgi:uncharacterized membrane protein
VRIFPWQKQKQFFTEEEKNLIVNAVRDAERMTSGEVRVFVESCCSYMDALDRAAELFFRLQMNNTKDRNAVLVYVAIRDHQLAVFGDEGIHQKVGSAFWKKEISAMISNFNRENYADGIRQCVMDIGEALHRHFPYNNDTDKNELPDNIVFGK